MRPGTDQHDLNFKLGKVRKFLLEGDKVKITVMFRGREIVHADYGRRILLRLLKDVTEQAILEVEPKQEGKTLSMILSPRKQPASQKTTSPR